MSFIKVEKDIWKLKDGSLWEGNVNECPESNPDNKPTQVKSIKKIIWL